MISTLQSCESKVGKIVYPNSLVELDLFLVKLFSVKRIQFDGVLLQLRSDLKEKILLASEKTY